MALPGVRGSDSQMTVPILVYFGGTVLVLLLAIHFRRAQRNPFE